MSFLKINNLSVDYKMRKETVYAAKNVNIDVNKGEILGLVGESGSGKSTVGNAIINLIDEPGKISSGSVILGDLNIHETSESIVKYRGNKIGLIFQDPQTSLNPILTVGEQLIETIQTHLKLNKDDAKNKSINLLKEVGIKDAEKRFLETREIGFDDWKSGNKLWIIDSIFKRKHNEAMIYYRTFFTHLIGVGKPVQWLRLAANGLIRSHVEIKTKEYYL